MYHCWNKTLLAKGGYKNTNIQIYKNVINKNAINAIYKNITYVIYKNIIRKL